MTCSIPEKDSRCAGFTLMEVATSVVILLILATLGFPVVADMRARSEAVKCKTNLSALGLGMSSYIGDHQIWPQIANDSQNELQSSPLSADSQSRAEKWISVLEPYGISEAAWHCPTVQRRIKADGSLEAQNKKRIDYLPTRFDSDADSPRRWPKHPWFVERGSLHPSGPNVLFADGSVLSLNELTKGF